MALAHLSFVPQARLFCRAAGGGASCHQLFHLHMTSQPSFIPSPNPEAQDHRPRSAQNQRSCQEPVSLPQGAELLSTRGAVGVSPTFSEDPPCLIKPGEKSLVGVGHCWTLLAQWLHIQVLPTPGALSLWATPKGVASSCLRFPSADAHSTRSYASRARPWHRAVVSLRSLVGRGASVLSSPMDHRCRKEGSQAISHSRAPSPRRKKAQQGLPLNGDSPTVQQGPLARPPR